MLNVRLLSGHNKDARTSGQVLYSGGRRQAVEGLVGEWPQAIEKYKDEGWELKVEVVALKAEVKRLDGAIHQVEKLTEANIVLTEEVASPHESIEKAKANAF